VPALEQLNADPKPYPVDDIQPVKLTPPQLKQPSIVFGGVRDDSGHMEA